MSDPTPAACSSAATSTLVRKRFPFAQSLVIAVALVLCGIGESRATADQAPPPFDDFPKALQQPGIDPEDRLAMLNLIHFYSHLADGLHTELFGDFFTKDAVFALVPYGASSSDPKQIIGEGRAAIIESLRPRHALFRRDKIQRRHFLTNPIVWDQTDERARVSVYLQLQSIAQGGSPTLVATGRYEGRAVKTLQGWRMAEWTIYSDQVLE